MITREKNVQFEQFYRQYRLYVHALCCRKFARPEDAEDLESLVWIEIGESFDKFNRDSPRSLLYKLVDWRSKDLYRQRYRTKNYETELDGKDKALLQLLEKASTSQHSKEEQMTLHQILAKESELDRLILFGRYVEGYTWEELAKRHNLHRNTLLKRSHAALKRLKVLLQDSISAGDKP